MRAVRLKTERMVNPLGIDVRHPDLSWICDGGVRQSAYRIIAEELSGKKGAENRKVIWDSGKISSSAMQVRFPEELESRQRIGWKVELWDEKEQTEGWSEEAFFEKAEPYIDSVVKTPCNKALLAQVLHQRCELMSDIPEQIDFIDEPVELGFDCPLDLHCTYTRDQLLVALDFMKPSTVREGVKWLPEKNIDVFFVTLNKADKDYLPTTMYNDYSINESLFHWQSQSTTAENSPTGQRYIHHKERGSKVLLFVREFKSDRMTGGAEAYTYLGTANYVKHTGSRPMNITWQLDRPIPAKFLKKTNKLVVG